jgi:hypothetical protein
MEYMIVRIKIPKPTRSWCRFRIRTLLSLMLIVGVGASWWNTRWNSEVANARRERDAALWMKERQGRYKKNLRSVLHLMSGF